MRNQFECRHCGGVYFDADLQGHTYHHVCPPLPADEFGVAAPDADGRNENIVSINRTAACEIVDEGEGVTCLTDKNLAEPAWITRMKADAEKVLGEED